MIANGLLLETGVPESIETDPWLTKTPSQGWKVVESGIWRTLSHNPLPRYGWKIHISATIHDAQNVLRLVAGIAFRRGCSFKYLRGADSYRSLHFKNANRLQSGKFIALYPESESLAREILDELYQPLTNYIGIDILTDRAYRHSTNIFYRWGAFYSTGRVNEQGEREELVPDGNGNLVPDRRLPRFLLPDCMLDPFLLMPEITHEYSPPATVQLDEFIIETVVRFTNAGGRYRGKSSSTSSDIFIKEARPGTGFVGTEDAISRLRREAAAIEKVNAYHQDVAPAIVKKFIVSGHHFIAMSFLPGTSLSEWIARQNPLYSSLHRSEEEVRAYLNRAERILNSIWSGLQKLHGIGLAFGDLSVGNLIIDDEEQVRFIDFESTTDVRDTDLGLRTPDFCLLKQTVPIEAGARDIYAFHCIAISMVLRLTTLGEISNHVFSEVSKDLKDIVGELPSWWSNSLTFVREFADRYSACKASNFCPPSVHSHDDRTRLRADICTAMLESYSPDRDFIFPTSSFAVSGSPLSFGLGCSGLLHSLGVGHHVISKSVIFNFEESVRKAIRADVLPMNYDVGLVGIGTTCAAIGLEELAQEVFHVVRGNWTKISNPSLGHGLAGVALAFAHIGEASLAEEIMALALNNCDAHEWVKNGFLYGRSGVIASACQFPNIYSGMPHLSQSVVRLIDEELRQTERHPKAKSLSLKGERDGTRFLPYLADGTAGLLFALIQAHKCQSVEFVLDSEMVVMLSADLGTPFMLEGSLFDGAAGLALVLEIAREEFPDLADQIPSPGWHRLEKFFVPCGTGIGVLHPRSLKYDFSRSQGSAGILETLLWLDGLSALNLYGIYLPPRSNGSLMAN